jgi:hypothetical protein
MTQLRSRQGLRAIGVRYLGLCGLAIAGLALPASGVLGKAHLVPGAFDDWSPSGRTEPPPRARPAPTPTPSPAPTPAPAPTGRLGYSTILGSWCSPASRYRIERRQLIVILNDGKRVVFPVTGYKFTAATIEISWTSKGESKRTIFGRFSADRRRMDQFGVNRTYNRC